MKSTLTKTITSRKLVLYASLLAGLLATGAVDALAGGPGHWGPPPGSLMMLRWMKGIDLTDQQELQFAKLRKDMRTQGKTLHQQIKPLLSQIIDELDKPTADPAKINALLDQGMQGFTAMVHASVEEFVALHATFTTQQRTTFISQARAMQARACPGTTPASASTSTPPVPPTNGDQ